MPLFPLGVTYLPFTQPTLNIFEPRYRSMYNDILFSGARRFMVCNVDQETGRMAEVGVIFYLDELKEVSEQTDDRVKYIGTHSVKGRVQIKKVLNPKDGATRETYMKAEVADFEYDPTRYQRGLLIDKRRGNLLKLDRHKYVKVAYQTVIERHASPLGCRASAEPRVSCVHHSPPPLSRVWHASPL